MMERLDSLSEDIDWNDMRGAKGVSLDDGKVLYVMGGTNSIKYKAL